MTWVIADRSVLHSFIAADMRVTWPGAHFDCLQKIHAVAPNVIVGFAGSALLGLEVAEAMRNQWRLHNLHTLRSIYSRYPRLFARKRREHVERLRRDGHASPRDQTEFLMLSQHPMRPFGGMTSSYRIHRFAPPHYEAREVRSHGTVSIGSGNDHALLSTHFRFVRDYPLEFRFHRRPDVFGGRVAAELFQFLSAQPVDTVSKWFVYGTFTPRGQVIKPHVDIQVTREVGDPVASVTTQHGPTIIQDVATYRVFAGRHNLQAAAAMA